MKLFIKQFIFWMVNLELLASCAVLENHRELTLFPITKPSSYIVREGDTLYDIGQKYGIDYKKLADWNHIDSNATIRPGQTIFFSPQPDSLKPKLDYLRKNKQVEKKRENLPINKDNREEKKTESRHDKDDSKKAKKKAESGRNRDASKKEQAKTESRRGQDNTSKRTKKKTESAGNSKKEKTNPESSLEDSIEFKK